MTTDAVDTTEHAPPLLTVQGRQATITLRRPRVANRLEIEDLAVLSDQVAQVERMPEVLVLRLQSLGRHFCSGFNIGQVAGPQGGSQAGARFEALAGQIERARPVTVAVIQGGVHGGATDLALACDLRVGSPAAELSVPAARLGLLFYQGGLERYVRRLGLAQARRVLLLAERWNARQMLDAGYLDRLADAPDMLGATADTLCLELAGMAPLALLGMKRHLNAIARGELDPQALAADIAACDRSSDLIEGARAWQEKRTPVFTGT